jgi:hypothetical protein
MMTEMKLLLTSILLLHFVNNFVLHRRMLLYSKSTLKLIIPGWLIFANQAPLKLLGGFSSLFTLTGFDDRYIKPIGMLVH